MTQKKRYWEQETLKYNWPHARMQLIAETIRQSPSGSSVLDLGAGKALLAHLIGPSYRYLGLDLVGETGERPRVDACDFDHLEQFHLSGAPYDIIVASGLLEYLEDWRGLLSHAINHWLAFYGIVLVSFTNARGYNKGPFNKHPEWRNMLSLPEILEELTNLKLTVEVVYPMLWGNKRWGLPFVKALAAHNGNFLRLDRPWVSQFLCVVRPHSKPDDQ